MCYRPEDLVPKELTFLSVLSKQLWCSTRYGK